MLQNEMQRLMAEGGVMQEGGTVDPVSGNEVPPGAMQEEVRDDVDAKLSEGEFVFPADVVRYLGLQKLMQLRDKAKEGLRRMEEIGQMGNAEQVENPEALHSEGGEMEMDDDEFESEIDSMLAEEGGGEQEFAVGGMAQPQDGTEMKKYVDANGNSIFIPFVDNVAQIEPPPGYRKIG
jgi:Arc/MetJ-type ribon-helix-helix transcriptional regulator